MFTYISWFEKRSLNILQRYLSIIRGYIFTGIAVFVVFGISIGIATAEVEHPQLDTTLFKWEKLPGLPSSIDSSFVAGVIEDELVVAAKSSVQDHDTGKTDPQIERDYIFTLSSPDSRWRDAGKLPQSLKYGGLILAQGNNLPYLCCPGQETRNTDGLTLHSLNKAIADEYLPSLPKSAEHLFGVILENTIYVGGSHNQPSSSEVLNIFWSLDLSESSDRRGWQELESWPGPSRKNAIAVVQRGALFLLGGTTLEPKNVSQRNSQYLNDAYRYTPNTGWKQIADLPYSLKDTNSAAVPIGETHLLILGAASYNKSSPLDKRKILTYHTITDTWVKRGYLPRELSSMDSMLTASWWQKNLAVLGEGGISDSEPPEVWLGKVARKTATLGVLDYVAVGSYFLILVCMGFYFSRDGSTTRDYFLGGQRIHWLVVGASVVGTQISAISFMASPAKSYSDNWIFIPPIFMLALVVTPIIIHYYLPFFRRLEITTAYEYLEKRFNVTVRLIASTMFILFQIGRISVILYLAALAISTVTAVNIQLIIIFAAIIAILYTYLGGITAVIWTDVLQLFVLGGSALLCLVIAITQVEGGIGSVLSMGLAESKFAIGQPGWDISSATLWVLVIGSFFTVLTQFTADQAIVQRYLTTKTEEQAARSLWFNAIVNIPIGIIFIALGTAIWAFYKTHPMLLDPSGNNDNIIPWFVVQNLPVGFVGFVLVGLLAAAMSTIDSGVNSIATVIITDFHDRFRRKVSDRLRLQLAHYSVAVVGVITMFLSLYISMQTNLTIMDEWIKLLGLAMSGVAGIFISGIFFRKITAAGVLVGFVVSSVVIYFVQSTDATHYFLYAAVGIITCVTVGWVASLCMPQINNDLEGLTIYSLKK